MLKAAVVLVAAFAATAFAASAALAPRTVAVTAPPAYSAPAPDISAEAPGDNTCQAPEFEQAAAANARSRQALAWAPFGRDERGWAIYEAHVAREIDTSCEADTSGFAQALARWQSAHRRPETGEADVGTLTVFKAEWQDARPYVALRASGVCPDPPAELSLASLSPDEGYKGKAIQLKADVADAYRRMVAAARAEVPELANDTEMLAVFSGYRSPAYDEARCARDGNCGGAARAKCSVHRTATAFDLVVGAAPGFSVDSSADANRLYQSRTPAYRWLVANAGRFGFINYAFEPWHWEYVGPGQIAGASLQASTR